MCKPPALAPQLLRAGCEINIIPQRSLMGVMYVDLRSVPLPGTRS